MKLSNEQKLIVAMLADLRKAMDGQSDASELDFDFVMEAIYSDNEWGIEEKYNGLFPKAAQWPQEVKDVYDFLDMWRFIEEAVATFSPAEKAKVSAAGATQYPGFDGNNETRYLGIARFITEQLGGFESIGKRGATNSHSPKVAKYRLMYGIFKDIRPNLVGRSLTPDEVITILDV